MVQNLNKHSTHRNNIAVLIPCYNEELTIAKVITDFQRQLPNASIYVFDNASTDQTVTKALEAGAEVVNVKYRGKGNVVQYMSRFIDADFYIMVDGDDTYPAKNCHELLAPILDGKADMVVGSRLLLEYESDFRYLNRLGNKLFVGLLNSIFNVKITDMLSGYRVMNRELFDGIPILSRGFEIETELTIRALEAGYVVQEIPVQLIARREGSHSKINIIKDGIRILRALVTLFRDYKPLLFFGSIGVLAVLIGITLGIGVIRDYAETGLVLRFPTAILAASLVLLGFFVSLSGLILETINRRFLELHFQLRRYTRDRYIRSDNKSAPAEHKS